VTDNATALIEAANTDADGDTDQELTALIRNAYLEKARQYHPDRNNSAEAAAAFVAVRRAYEHLTVHKGVGQQRNERHDIKTMISSLAHATSEVALGSVKLEPTDSSDSTTPAQTFPLSTLNDLNASSITSQTTASTTAHTSEPVCQGEDASPLMFFKARLLATLLDYGSGGMPASSLRKKWREIWPDDLFPSSEEMHLILEQHEQQGGARARRNNKCKKIKVLSFLKVIAADCCRIEDTQLGVEPLLFAIETKTSPQNVNI
jgi:hypothetical protein